MMALASTRVPVAVCATKTPESMSKRFLPDPLISRPRTTVCGAVTVMTLPLPLPMTMAPGSPSRIADTIELVRGPSGTEVRLAIERDGAGIELAITRRLIRTEDVRSEVLADGRVGYLRVDTFSVGAAGDFHSRLRRPRIRPSESRVRNYSGCDDAGKRLDRPRSIVLVERCG